jgi:hypothetical protein
MQSLGIKTSEASDSEVHAEHPSWSHIDDINGVEVKPGDIVACDRLTIRNLGIYLGGHSYPGMFVAYYRGRVSSLFRSDFHLHRQGPSGK